MLVSNPFEPMVGFRDGRGLGEHVGHADANDDREADKNITVPVHRSIVSANIQQCNRVASTLGGMSLLRSITLFVLAALAEIGGAWLVWQGVREHRGLLWIGAGVIALGAYGFMATFQPDPYFGRILAAYGGIFVAGSLLWGVVVDGFRPDRWDLAGE